ncbi:MAG: stress-induced protein [Brevundimonas sp.]|nr:stress-induced protein [Brevundimonas sp.]
MDNPQINENGTSRRGFAALSPERRKEISRLGGGAVPAEKRSFAQDRSLARNAGKLGGKKSRPSKEASDV